MADLKSWAWMGNGTWPDFSPRNPDNIGSNGNGLGIKPDARDIVWSDANDDNVISDNDADRMDGIRAEPTMLHSDVKAAYDRAAIYEARAAQAAVSIEPTSEASASEKSGDWSGAGKDRVIVDGEARTVHEFGVYNESTIVLDGKEMVVPVSVWVFTDGTYMLRINDADIPKGMDHVDVQKIALGIWDKTEHDGSSIENHDGAFVCFAADTLILAQGGLVAVQDLRPGDRVMTADHGFQPLRWVGQASVSGQGRGAPVVIAAGALGNTRDLCVSRQHRMVLGGWRAELMFGTAEVLVPALHLVNDSTVRIVPCDRITYVHLLFDQHEIIFAEGIASESFHPGAVGLSLLDQATREEVLQLFPHLRNDAFAFGPAARPALNGRQAALMAQQIR